MRQIAQTNLQLYNQMLMQQWPQEDLLLVRKAYDLSALLTAGYYQADGKPFVCHTVGVASILCMMRSPAKFIAFGLLHNIYSNGDFGEGLGSRLTPDKREFVRVRVGSEVEALIFRFRRLRVGPSTIDNIEARLDTFDETERQLIAADLADHIEKYADQGVLYFGDGSWITKQTNELGARMIVLAQKLGQPMLAEMMGEAFAAFEDQPPVTDVLRQSPNRQYVAQTVPLSTRRRFVPRFRAYLYRLRHRL